MTHAAMELERYLEGLCAAAAAGDRLPTVRSLMQQFGVSQTVVQRVFDGFKARGLIASHVGRGTYFQAAGEARAAPASAPAAPDRPGAAAASRVRSVLLLRRSASIERGRALLEALQARLVADGHSVLEVSYTDPEHARAALQGLPHFDACVLQSTFKAIPTDLLASLRPRVDVIAVDGVALVGMDVESVGTEWGDPLEVAVEQLQSLGHRVIGFAHSTHQLLATQLGQRRLERLQARLPQLVLRTILVPCLPGPDYERTLVEQLHAQRTGIDGAPITALVAWGVDDGGRLRSALADVGFAVPGDLSVVLLGRTDIAQEHDDFFDTVGCAVSDQAESLHQAIAARWRSPEAPYSVRLIPLARRAGQSCAPMRASTDSVSDSEAPT